MRRLLLLTVVTVTVFALSACYYGGPEVAFEVPSPDKIPPNLDTVVRVALYVDTDGPDARAELEAAGRYSIFPAKNETEVPYFDYVILSGAGMKRGRVSAYLELSGSLKSVLSEYNSLIKPLRGRGIKVLLGIKGGRDGVSFASLPGDFGKEGAPPPEDFPTPADVNGPLILKSRIKNKPTFSQGTFAYQVVDVCIYYRLDGAEFWDEEGESAAISPYPELGGDFFNGEKMIPINNERDSVYYWVRGGGNFIDMLTYVLEEFGAANTFQGELDIAQRLKTPLLVREVNFGKRFPTAVPRYDFSATLGSLTYIVGNSTTEFGWEDSEEPFPSPENWLPLEDYSPVIIDLVSISDAVLEEYSRKLGRRVRGDGTEIRLAPRYGLVYYGSIGRRLGDGEQERRLSVTSEEVFGKPVRYDK